MRFMAAVKLRQYEDASKRQNVGKEELSVSLEYCEGLVEKFVQPK